MSAPSEKRAVLAADWRHLLVELEAAERAALRVWFALYDLDEATRQALADPMLATVHRCRALAECMDTSGGAP